MASPGGGDQRLHTAADNVDDRDSFSSQPPPSLIPWWMWMFFGIAFLLIVFIAISDTYVFWRLMDDINRLEVRDCVYGLRVVVCTR